MEAHHAGSNTFSMAIAGPLFSFGIYKLGIRFGWNRKAVIFAAAFLGDLLTYCVTSIQLALAIQARRAEWQQAL